MGILKDLREVVGNMGRKKAGTTAKCCPRCGNPLLYLSSSLDVWLTPEQYICKKCGYKGPIVMELCKEQETDETINEDV